MTPAERQGQNLTIALEMQAAGFAVLPCRQDKKPIVALVAQGYLDATTDRELIRLWWRDYPEAVPGIVPGSADCIVFDLDTDKLTGEQAGQANWAELCRAHAFDDAGAIKVTTPSGGLHVYLQRRADRVRVGNESPAPHIDVRCDSGYVIAPGATMPDSRAYGQMQAVYELSAAVIAGCLPNAPVGLLRGWRLEERLAEAGREPAFKDARSGAVADRERKYAAAALVKEAGEVTAAVEGTRNSKLNEAAFSLGTMVAADWIAEHEVEGELAAAAAICGLDENEAARTIESGLTAGKKKPRAALSEWPAGFDMRVDGFYRIRKDRDEWLSGPFLVLGQLRDPSGDRWAILLQWLDGDGRVHRHSIAFADLLGTGADVFKPLADGGLNIAPAPFNAGLKDALTGLKSTRRITAVHRTGWHEGRVFVLPDGALGQADNDSIVFVGDARPARYSRSGTLEGWASTVGAHATANHRLIFALSVAAAGVVLDLLQDEGGGFNFVGGSSIGKSTALFAAASLWGGKSFVQSWRATSNGLEGSALLHSGTCFVLDELGQLADREAGEAAYMLANGQGKARASVTGQTRQRAEWRTIILSSGETTLADKMNATGKRAKAGQLVRIIDIPADADAGHGLFDDTKGVAAANFADAVKTAAASNYGTAGPELAARLAEEPERFARSLRREVDTVATAFLEAARTAEGQVARMARRFATVAVAGEHLNIAVGSPWTAGAAQDAARICFLAALGRRGGTASGEVLAALEAIRNAVERYGDTRFKRLGEAIAIPGAVDGSGRLHNVAGEASSATLSALPNGDRVSFQGLLGYRFRHDGEEVWAFTVTGFKDVTGEVADPSVVAKMLGDHGALAHNDKEGRFRLTKKVDGKSVKLYAFKDSAITEH